MTWLMGLRFGSIPDPKDEAKLTKFLAIRVSEKHFQEMHAAAKQEGISTSAFARRCAEEAIRRRNRGRTEAP